MASLIKQCKEKAQQRSSASSSRSSSSSSSNRSSSSSSSSSSVFNSSSSTSYSSSIYDRNTTSSIYMDKKEEERYFSGDNQAKSSGPSAFLTEEQKKIAELNKKANGSTAEDESPVHGMSNEEYLELCEVLEDYGINYENLSHGNFKNVAKTLANQIDKLDENGVSLYDKMAASYDSVLDLVLDEKLNMAAKELGLKGSWKYSDLMKHADELKEKYGIVVNKENSRNYTISLVDENGNIIMDGAGKLAQVIKSDNMLPDGHCQEVEKFASAALDQMGYDCVSITDLTPAEYQMIKQLASLDIVNSELGVASSIIAEFKGGAGTSLYSQGYSVSPKSLEYWSQHKSEYNALVNELANGSANIPEGLKSSSMYQGISDTRIKLSKTQFDKKVQDEMAKDDEISQSQAENIVSKQYCVAEEVVAA